MQCNEDFRDKITELLRQFKGASLSSSEQYEIPLIAKGETVAFLRPMSFNMMSEKKESVQLLARWRAKNWRAYPTVFKVTLEGTSKWIQSQLLEREDRILFMIETVDGNTIGHLGLSNYDFKNKEAEIDNVVRGVDTTLPGVMTLALNTLSCWAFKRQGLERLFLRVFSDNKKAIALYERCGFKIVKEIPLHKIVEGDVIKYEEVQHNMKLSVDRIFVLMELLSTT